MTAKDEIREALDWARIDPDCSENRYKAYTQALKTLDDCIVIRKSDVDSGLKAAGLLNLNNIETKALIGELIAKAKDE